MSSSLSKIFSKVLFILFLPCSIWAQEGSGTFLQDGSGTFLMENSYSHITSASHKQIFSETIYLGPQADIVVDGVLEIWCKEIWIAPEANITGSGRIVLNNPGDNPYYTSMAATSTIIDGNNGRLIDLLLDHHNTQGIHLGDLPDPGYGTLNPAGADAARLNLGSTLALQDDGAHIFLNGYHLGFGPQSHIQHHQAARMIITGNNPQAHVIKEFQGAGQFTFPIGISAGDYSPVSVTAPAPAGQVFANVVDDFRSDIRLKYPENAIKRSWNIFSPEGLTVELTLDHGTHTPGTDYDDIHANITQYLGAQKIDFLSTIRQAQGIHHSPRVQLATSNLSYQSWFTKYSGFEEGILIPNTFTPNGDGLNDQFVIQGLMAFDQVEINIFNRWGNVIFSHQNYDNSWSGQGLNDGTYFYLINVRKGHMIREYKGWILLHRNKK